MLFNAVLGSLEEKMFFAPNPQRTTFKIRFAVSFINKTHGSFLKS